MDSDNEDTFHDCAENGDVLNGENGIRTVNSHSPHGNYGNGTSSSSMLKANGVEIRGNGHKSTSSSSSGELSVWGARSKLPATMFSRADFSIWSFLRHCIGKELSKITMPVVFNEPLSFLQRVVEYLEYHTLLIRASESNDPIERHELVTAFAVSAAASNWERIGKPFNPLLCETYELEREDLGFRIVCEQVSHHPPVSAFHADAPQYTFHGSMHPKLKFWGKSVEVTPKGLVTLYLKRHNEAYSWQNINCCVHNVIVGKLWIEHYGTMEVTNHKNNFKSVLNFRPCGWFGKDMHKVEGFLFDNQKRKIRAYYGKWVDAFYSFSVDEYDLYMKLLSMSSKQSNTSSGSGYVHTSVTSEADLSTDRSSSMKAVLEKCNSEPYMTDTSPMPVGTGSNNEVPDEMPAYRHTACDLHVPSQKLLWMATPKPPHANCYYSFTSFAMMLNELDDRTRNLIPPTDSRLRPDIRNMEDGSIDLAGEEKNRIEEKQRSSSRKDKKKKDKKDEPTPVWFKQGRNPYTEKEDWLFTGEYWKRDWSRCPDIF